MALPYQEMDSYAAIKNIEQIQSGANNGKWTFYLEPPASLNTPVKIGNAEPSSLMRGKKTTLSKLLTVQTIDQL